MHQGREAPHALTVGAAVQRVGQAPRQRSSSGQRSTPTHRALRAPSSSWRSRCASTAATNAARSPTLRAEARSEASSRAGSLAEGWLTPRGYPRGSVNPA